MRKNVVIPLILLFALGLTACSGQSGGAGGQPGSAAD
jgi:hypothetical protein